MYLLPQAMNQHAQRNHRLRHYFCGKLTQNAQNASSSGRKYFHHMSKINPNTLDHLLGTDILAQEYLSIPQDEFPGNFHCLIFNNKVLRVTQDNHVGMVEPEPLLPPVVQLALKAARALELKYAIVDIMESENGLKIIDVNHSPSLFHDEDI